MRMRRPDIQISQIYHDRFQSSRDLRSGCDLLTCNSGRFRRGFGRCTQVEGKIRHSRRVVAKKALPDAILGDVVLLERLPCAAETGVLAGNSRRSIFAPASRLRRFLTVDAAVGRCQGRIRSSADRAQRSGGSTDRVPAGMTSREPKSSRSARNSSILDWSTWLINLVRASTFMVCIVNLPSLSTSGPLPFRFGCAGDWSATRHLTRPCHTVSPTVASKLSLLLCNPSFGRIDDACAV